MTCQGCAGSGGAGITKPLGLKTFSPSLCLSLPLFPFFTLFLFLSLLSLHLLLILKMKNACSFLYTVALDQGSQPLHNYCWQSNHSLMGVGGGVLLCFVESSAPLSHSDTSPHISKCPRESKTVSLRVTDLVQDLLSSLEADLIRKQQLDGDVRTESSHSLWATLPFQSTSPHGWHKRQQMRHSAQLQSSRGH